MSYSREFPFVITKYRFVHYDTRKIAELCNFSTLGEKDKTLLLFLIEANLYRFSFASLRNWLAQMTSWENVFHFLEELMHHKPMRNDAMQINLLAYAKLWDALTTRLHVVDYSYATMRKQGTFVSSFPEDVALKAISECPEGRNIDYVLSIAERIRNESIIPTLRQEEKIQEMLRNSQPLRLPTYTNPGFITQALAEDAFFREI